MFWSYIFVLVQISMVVQCFTKPEKPCKPGDIECMMKIGKDIFRTAFSQDNNDLGLEVLDPMHQELIEANLPSVKFSLKDSTVKGFKNLILKQLIVISPTSLRFEIHVPSIEMSGNYKVLGKLLNIAIEGEGKMFVNATNMDIHVGASKNISEKNGKHYLELYNIQPKSELLGTMNLQLENLFNGNKEQAEPVLKFINNNPNLVASSLQNPISTANMNKIVKNCNKILANIAIEDMYVLEK